MDKLLLEATTPNGKRVAIVASRIDGFGVVAHAPADRGVIYTGTREIEVRESYDSLVRVWHDLQRRVAH